ncbi:MAG: EAL domain-containing protein [Gammaproteobacteria bacterium]|jgi:diguanylate cyclase (GGDEF)-like protein/PAS domain S-box-containing protein
MARHKRIKILLHSFAGRITIGVILIHALLIPFLFGVVFIIEAGYKQQFIEYVRHGAAVVAEQLSEEQTAGGFLHHLNDAALSGGVLLAQLVTENGTLYSSTVLDKSIPPADFQEDFRFGEHGDSIYYISLPISTADGKSATVQMGFDEAPTQEQIQKAYHRVEILAVSYIALSLLPVAFLIPQLTRPLRKLRDTAQKIADGEATEQLTVKSSIYEISDLAEDLESMRHELVNRSQAIIAREGRISAIMNNVVDGIITIDENGTVESMNPAALQIFGYEQSDIININLEKLLDDPNLLTRNQRDPANSASIKFPITNLKTHETVGRHRDGSTFPIEIAISELTRSEGRLFIAIVRDITERKRSEEELKALHEDLERRVIKRTRELASLNQELEHQALHDALTELPNRLLLQDRMHQALLSAQRDNRQLALLITDLDRFKEINDTLGHHYGDLVLQGVSARMRTALRGSDTIARLGGDEFAVLLPFIESGEDAIKAARKLVTTMEEPIVLEDHSFHVGISVGIALYPDHGQDGSTLMRHADVAMYVAKRSTSGYAVYDHLEDQHSVSRLAMVGELRHAIEQQQLVLFYQPKIDLKEGRITGVEALVRWNHPQRGLLSPDEFIPLAEHTGLIRPLTFVALNEALHQVSLWKEGGLRLKMAVNLSAHHLQDEQLASKVESAMQQWNVPAELLEFEITESAIMANPLRAMNTLTQLSRMGIGLSIDDFGTGYSSLVYLKQLPVNEIKIDKSFVIDMLENNEDMVIVRSTIDLAHNMGRQVVAEGVESEEVLNILVELGCDMAQGYYISRPITANILTQWLHQTQWQSKRVRG